MLMRPLELASNMKGHEREKNQTFQRHANYVQMKPVRHAYGDSDKEKQRYEGPYMQQTATVTALGQ